ncbi:hypothetical protein BDV98DRAFT_122080 [Pterulicium gracile]|uniref:Uncharacterized protein n=1 Tax=Pterulicium gracile TaxID=1884261 RepID=A0A5C3QES3_9AGAR|nr:hypothetical protein BDV98DRAFT_122080 [Pterula gracilis]
MAWVESSLFRTAPKLTWVFLYNLEVGQDGLRTGFIPWANLQSLVLADVFITPSTLLQTLQPASRHSEYLSIQTTGPEHTDIHADPAEAHGATLPALKCFRLYLGHVDRVSQRLADRRSQSGAPCWSALKSHTCP